MMNQIKNTIHALLEWGRGQKQLPTDNFALKNQIIARLQPIPAKALFSSRQIPWVSFAFSGLAVLMLFISPDQLKRINPIIPMTLPGLEETNKTNSQLGLSRDYSLYPLPLPDIPITDTREFIKTDYNATIRTRHIDELVQIIQNTIHTLDGRIDGSNSSKYSGYVNFVIPKSKFEDFRWTIKTLAGERFLVENVYNENMLPQKQSIEKQKSDAEKILAGFESDKNQLKLSHKRTAESIQSKINQINNDLIAIKIELDITNDPTERSRLKAQEDRLLNERSGLEINLISENSIYIKKLNTLDVQIRDNQTVINDLDNQDRRIIDTVATVHGTILLDRISIWGIIRLYVPINLGFIIFSAGAIITYFAHRRRSYLLS